MGTNYYTKINNCEHCKRFDELHLGKSSGGWEFTFQYNGGKFYKNIEEMKRWLEDKNIYDEYKRDITYEDFWKLVESKIGGLNHYKECPTDKSSFNTDGYTFSDCEFS